MVGVALVSIAWPVPAALLLYTKPADDLRPGLCTASGGGVCDVVWAMTTGKAPGKFQRPTNVATRFRSPPSRTEVRFCRNGSLSSAPRLVQQ